MDSAIHRLNNWGQIYIFNPAKTKMNSVLKRFGFVGVYTQTNATILQVFVTFIKIASKNVYF